MEKSDKEGISRRQFLKVAGTAAGVLAAGSLGSEILSASTRRGESAFLSPEERYPRELELYGVEGVRYIDKIEKELNLIVPLPETFRLDNVFSESQEEVANQVWKLEELQVLAEIAEQLPEKFKLEEQTILGVFRGPYRGFGGGAGETSAKSPFLALFGPQEYQIDAPSTETHLWPSLGEELKAIFTHEVAHLITSSDRELIENYAEQVGWEKRDSEWVFTGERGLVNEIMERREHDLHEGPEEDIAVAAMIVAVNPQLLIDSRNSLDHRRLSIIREELFS